MEQEINQLLKNQGFSNTKTRRAVLQAMLRTQPATIQQLITALPEVDRATVYRTLDLYVDLGIAKRVSAGMEQRNAIEQTASNNLFRPIRHDLEISGYCSSCSN